MPSRGIDTAGALAHALAERARRLRALVLVALTRGDAPLTARYARLAPALACATPAAFADAYAQTVTVGLLSARWLTRASGQRFTRAALPELLPTTSLLLRELLQDLLDVAADEELRGPLDDLTELLAGTRVEQVFAGSRDPSIHFYEAFLDRYDPRQRRARGVWYTPDEVVDCMVRTVDRALRERFGLRLGLADATRWGELDWPLPANTRGDLHVVQILDPALGTGTFLLGALRVIFATMCEEFNRRGYDDATAARAWAAYVRDDLLPRVHGFELTLAPYTVAHLRLGLALAGGLAEERGLAAERWGVRLGEGDRLRVLLTDTLALRGGPGFAAEAREAERLKTDTPVLVVLGNPPYERISGEPDGAAGWVIGGAVPGRAGDRSLFDDIRDVAREHAMFSHLRSLSDRYVYFWRWAIWKALEHPASPGVVAFVTNSTWLVGPGFVGLRKLVREQCEALWIIDHGGEQRGTRPEPNIFNIETPVAITIGVRTTERASGAPAEANYRRIVGGSARAKLDALCNVAADGLAGAAWTRASAGWLDPLVPSTGDAAWQAFVPLTELFPWQQPGCLAARTWPIAPDAETLARRWSRFVAAPAAGRSRLFATARTGRNIHTGVAGRPPLASLGRGAEPAAIVRYCLRSFDRQWVFEDPRLLKTESPSLWRSASDRQIFLCTLMSAGISEGPALTVAAHVPDFHHFRGSYGGKDVLPLYRDAAATQPNVTAGLRERLAAVLGIEAPSPEDLAAYVYALLSAPDYQRRFAEALRTPGPRVPLTRDPMSWRRAVELGRRLLWLHTYAERLRDPAAGRGARVPEVAGVAWARPVRSMPRRPADLAYDAATGAVAVGDGVIAGVRPEVWAYAVSGMPVLRKWLGYRTLEGAGKATRSGSELDRIRADAWPREWSDELLELVRVLTLTVDEQPAQAELLGRICEGPLVAAAELPGPTAAERRGPGRPRGAGSLAGRGVVSRGS